MFMSTVNMKVNLISIEKCLNKIVQHRFFNELKVTVQKYPGKCPTQLIKLLFHGTTTNKPKMVYASEEGLDMRFSRSGLFGQGIYFADNAAYSHTYAHTNEQGYK